MRHFATVVAAATIFAASQVSAFGQTAYQSATPKYTPALPRCEDLIGKCRVECASCGTGYGKSKDLTACEADCEGRILAATDGKMFFRVGTTGGKSGGYGQSTPIQSFKPCRGDDEPALVPAPAAPKQ